MLRHLTSHEVSGGFIKRMNPFVKGDAMGFLSWKRASTLYKMQKAIVPPHQSYAENMSSLRCSLATASETGRALEQYFDLCESDSEVRKVMEREDLVRFDLRGVLMRLLQRGLGEWVNNHYAALSTIAHATPLQYFVQSERESVNPEEVRIKLVKFWLRRISSQELLASGTPLRSSGFMQAGVKSR